MVLLCIYGAQRPLATAPRFIVLDQWRWDWTGLDTTTPVPMLTLKRLAAQGPALLQWRSQLTQKNEGFTMMVPMVLGFAQDDISYLYYDFN